MRIVIVLTFLFLVIVGVTIAFPSFPPAQFLYETFGLPHPAVTSSGLTAGSLMYGLANGFFWVIIATIALGVASSIRRSKSLPPMPAPTKLATPLIEAKEVDDRWVRTLPSATVTVLPDSPVSPVPASAPVVPSDVAYEPIVVQQDVEAVDGVSPVCGGLLRNAGIKTINDLLIAGAKEDCRRRLASDVGVDYSTLVKWVYQADLLRVRGVDPNYAALLESAKVSTVADLSARNPLFLSRALRAVNRERKLVRGRIATHKTIEGWVNEAKKLKPMVE